MTTTPFTNMTQTDIETLPDCDERAVLLAALWAEAKAEAEFGWDHPQHIVLRFLAPTAECAPAATIVPMGLADPAPMVEKIVGLTFHLQRDPTLRQHIARNDERYLGVGIISEAWYTTESSDNQRHRQEVRFVLGFLVGDEPFTVQRVRGSEPTVTFRHATTVGAETGIADALADLNATFKIIDNS